jgi:hypothetical protein
MKKEDLSAILGGAMVLLLVYLFWFTDAKKMPFWGKVFAWIFAVGTASSIGYALGKEPAKESTTAVGPSKV